LELEHLVSWARAQRPPTTLPLWLRREICSHRTKASWNISVLNSCGLTCSTLTAGTPKPGPGWSESARSLLDKESRTSRVQPTDVLQFSICVLHEFLENTRFGFVCTHQLARSPLREFPGPTCMLAMTNSIHSRIRFGRHGFKFNFPAVACAHKALNKTCCCPINTIQLTFTKHYPSNIQEEAAFEVLTSCGIYL